MRRKILVIAVFLAVILSSVNLWAKRAEEIVSKRVVQTRIAQSSSASNEPLFFVDCLSSERGQPRIYEYPSRRNLLFPSTSTSFFSVNIDGWLYQNQEEQWDFELVDSFRWETYTYGWCRFRSYEDVYVREDITIIREKVHLRLTFTNTDDYSHDIQVRYLLDTMIDQNDGAYLSYADSIVSENEIEYFYPGDLPIKAFDIFPDPSMSGVFENVEGNIWRMVFAAWPNANDTVWDYAINPFQTVNQDSALLIYYDLGVLAAGEEKAIEFTLGIPGDILITNPSPGPTSAWHPIVCQTHSHLLADSFDLTWQGRGLSLPISLGENLSANDLQEKYAKQGYSLVAITEHYPKFQELVGELWQEKPLIDNLIDSWDSMEDTALDSHVLGIGFDSSLIDIALVGSSNRAERVSQIQIAEGVAIVPHPNEPRFSWNSDQIASVRPEAIEIYNGIIYNAYRTAFGTAAGYACGFALGTWDDLLRSGVTCWGTASDDFTNNLLQWFDEGCIVVMSENPLPTQDELLSAISNGRFYASKGGFQNGNGAPKILGYYALPAARKARLVLESPDAYVKFVTAKWYRTRWVTPEVINGQIIADFDFADDDGYIRAEVHGFDGKTSFVQPIFLNRLDTKTSSWGIASADISTSGLNIDLAEARLELALGQSFSQVTAELVPIALRPSTEDLAAGIIGECYRFSPVVFLSGQNILSITFSSEELVVSPARLRIFQFTASGWQALPTLLEGDRAKANIISLGIFVLSAVEKSDSQGPQVSFSTPLNGGMVSGPIIVSCQASDDQGVVEITLSLDETFLDVDHWKADGWQFLFDFSPYPPGSHKLQALARDLSGNIGISEIDINISGGTPAPTISISHPVADSQIFQHLSLEGYWTDDQGLIEGEVTIGAVPVAKVDFYDNSTWQVDEWLSLLPVLSGSQELKVIAWDAYGNQAFAVIPIRVMVFADVPSDFWAFEAIYAIASFGISQGYDTTPPEYRPQLEVTRDQMAVFIARALAGSDTNVPAGPAVPSFNDVQTDFWAYKYIEYLKTRNIVTGYPDGSYQPFTPVTRDQMAVYIARSLCGGDSNVPAGPVSPTFSDVDSSSWAYKWIEYLVEEGIVKGYPDGSYQPLWVVTRDQMAVYLARAFVF